MSSRSRRSYLGDPIHIFHKVRHFHSTGLLLLTCFRCHPSDLAVLCVVSVRRHHSLPMPRSGPTPHVHVHSRYITTCWIMAVSSNGMNRSVKSGHAKAGRSSMSSCLLRPPFRADFYRRYDHRVALAQPSSTGPPQSPTPNHPSPPTATSSSWAPFPRSGHGGITYQRRTEIRPHE